MVEIPRAIWWFILNCIILVVRPKKSAEKYAQVWTKEGSPLLVHAQKQAQLLRGFLSQKIKSPFAVELGMSYGNPSMQSAIDKLRAQHCDRILVFPLYPQYAASSTAQRTRRCLASAAQNSQCAGNSHHSPLSRPPCIHCCIWQIASANIGASMANQINWS